MGRPRVHEGRATPFAGSEHRHLLTGFAGHPRRLCRQPSSTHPSGKPRDLRLAAPANRKLLRCRTCAFAAVLSGDQSVQHRLRGHPQRKEGGPDNTTVLVAGDSSKAKVALIEAVKAGGIEAIDAGGLNRARELEAMGFRPLKLAASEQ